MTFSKEEKQIWEGSEVMRELERIAKAQSLDTPDEAFLPIKEGQDWEDERSNEEKLMDAIEEFDKEEEKIDEQREMEDEFDEEKIMPVPEHDKELSDYSGYTGKELDPEDEGYDDQDDNQEYYEGEVRPWDWRGTLNPTEIKALLRHKRIKRASDKVDVIDVDPEEDRMMRLMYGENWIEETEEQDRRDQERWDSLSDEERAEEEKYHEEIGRRFKKEERARREKWQTEGPTYEQLEMMAEMDPEEREEFIAMMNKKDYIDVESNLINGLTKLASYLGKQGKVVEAIKVEDTIRDIRIALREANNG